MNKVKYLTALTLINITGRGNCEIMFKFVNNVKLLC